MTLNVGLLTGAGRVWIQKNGPNTAFEFLTAYGAGQVNRPGGTITPLYEPDPATHNGFRVVGKTKAPPGLPTVQLDSQYRSVASVLLSLKCPAQVQFRYGTCDRPDSPTGWDKILHFLNGDPAAWTLNPNVARDPANLAPMIETLELVGEDVFEFVKVAVQRVTVSETGNALSIAVSNQLNCGGICGAPVDICDTILIGTAPGGYGSSADLIVSTDGGATFAATAASPLGAGGSDIALAILGSRWIVVDGVSATPTIAYSDDSGATWTTVTSAAGAVGALKDISALDFNHIFFAGAGGIFISTDGGGTITTARQNTTSVNKIKVLNSLVGYAVGNSDVILKTQDGLTWAATTAVTGSGANLVALEVVSENEVWVGTATGKLFYTDNGGVTWTERTFSGSGTGSVNAIKFINAEAGYMIHDTGVPVGSLFRTVDGGKNWERSLTVGNGSVGATPTNAGLNALAVCGINAAFVAGPAQGGTAFIGIVE